MDESAQTKHQSIAIEITARSACRCRRLGRRSASRPVARQVANTKGRELAPRRKAICIGGYLAASNFMSASMIPKIPTAAIISVMPRNRCARSAIGIWKPRNEEPREARERGQVLLVGAIRIAAVRERGDDQSPAVRQLRVHDLGERVVGVTDLALVERAVRKAAAHAAVLREARPAQPRSDVVGGRPPELAGDEREHEARRAIGVHRVAPMTLAREGLEARGLLA